MTTLTTLKDLLIDKLRDLHNAETQLVKALPKMAEAASNAELEAVFLVHLEQSKEHIERLERALDLLDASPARKTCYSIKSLVDENDEAINAEAPETIRDANLIGAALRMEHYEIAAYGTVCSIAEKLFENEVAALLQLTLDEEWDTERYLSVLLEIVNEAASVATETEEGSVRT